jgi:hypothetical protein
MSVAGTRTFAGTSGILCSRSAALELPNHFQLSFFAEIVPASAKAGRKARRQNKRKQPAVIIYFRDEEGHF